MDGALDMGAYEFWAGCGNHLLEAGEICDDGNLRDGDGCSSACDCEPGLSAECPMRSCQDIQTNLPGAENGIYWTSLQNDPSVLLQVYCDFTTDGGPWTLIARLNSNDATTQQWSAPFWSAITEIGHLAGDEDYLSLLYAHHTDWGEILLDYRYEAGQSRRMAAVFSRANTDTMRSHTNLSPSNTNPTWSRTFTYSEGANADAESWYGDALRFQTVGNAGDGFGEDNFRIWFNRVDVSSCNQSGGIGGQGDGGVWYHELSFPSETPICQENNYRGTIGTNGGGNLMLEALLSPESAYNEGIMWIFVR